MTIAGYVPYFTIYTNAGTISLAPAAIIAIPAPVVPPIVPPDGGGYAGGGVRRIRQFAPRKRKREDEDEPVAQPAAQPIPQIPQIPQPPPLPPQPGLMAGIPMPPRTFVPPPPEDDEEADEIALLLELLS
jgi:hypothetical protein